MSTVLVWILFSANHYTYAGVVHAANLGHFASRESCESVGKQLQSNLDARIKTACIQALIFKESK